MQSSSKNSPQATLKTCSTATEVRARINELLWDFYDEFPLATPNWQEISITSPEF